MECIRVTKDNLDQEHICCALSNKADVQVTSIHQCPFNAKYVPTLVETAIKAGIPFRAIRIETSEAAQNAPTPVTTYALFCDGEYVTNEQLNDKKFLKLVKSSSREADR